MTRLTYFSRFGTCTPRCGAWASHLRWWSDHSSPGKGGAIDTRFHAASCCNIGTTGSKSVRMEHARGSGRDSGGFVEYLVTNRHRKSGSCKEDHQEGFNTMVCIYESKHHAEGPFVLVATPIIDGGTSFASTALSSTTGAEACRVSPKPSEKW